MLEVAAQLVFEVGCGLTGHLLLWSVTFGRWNISNGRDIEATIVGILFWIAVGIGVWFAFFR